MSQKSNVIVGLDIGTTNIHVVVAEISESGAVNISGVGSSPSRGLRKGVVINIEATVQSIAQAVESAETMAGTEISHVYAAISGSHIQSFNSHGIVGIKSNEVSVRDVEKVIEAAKAVAIPMDREVLHVLPQEYIVDGQDGIREPLGISGVRLEAKVHIVTGAIASARNIVKCANRCGLTVEDIVLAPIASARAVLSPEEQELGVCLIDIGGGTSDLAVFHKGAVKHTGVLAVGGNHITNDIAAGLRTPISDAEKIKCLHGTALLSMVDEDETIEVPSTGGRPPRILSKSVLTEIIEPRISEILDLVQAELIKSETREFLTSGIVLCGGTANLVGIREVTEELFHLPVRTAMPRQVAGLTDLVSGPEYATAVGLVLQGASSQQMSLYGLKSSAFSKLMRRASNWLSEHF